jgi:hypothetical protein
MARFFFHFRQSGILSIDEEGCDFPTVEDAYLSAFDAALDMWRELMAKRHDPRLCAFEVRDGTGTDIFVLPFVELLESCRDAPSGPVVLNRNLAAEAYQRHYRARQTMVDVSRTLNEAKTSLRETRDLLSRVL